MDFEPLEPTGYSDKVLWKSVPGFEVKAYISPATESHIQQVMKDNGHSHAKVVGSYVYGYFEFIESEVQVALEDINRTYTWLSYFTDSPLAALLIVAMDDFKFFLISGDEADTISEAMDKGCNEVDLGWITLFFDNGANFSVSDFDIPSITNGQD